MTEERLLEIEAIIAARLGLMTVHSRELLAALHEARAAAIELGETLAENERYEVLERVQSRCPWLVVFGEEKDHGSKETEEVDSRSHIPPGSAP